MKDIWSDSYLICFLFKVIFPRYSSKIFCFPLMMRFQIILSDYMILFLSFEMPISIMEWLYVQVSFCQNESVTHTAAYKWGYPLNEFSRCLFILTGCFKMSAINVFLLYTVVFSFPPSLRSPFFFVFVFFYIKPSQNLFSLL